VGESGERRHGDAEKVNPENVSFRCESFKLETEYFLELVRHGTPTFCGMSHWHGPEWDIVRHVRRDGLYASG
jgi:hypothetical protein